MSPPEDSHSGLVRTLGKRVGGNPSRVRIPHPPLHRRMGSDRSTRARARYVPRVGDVWVTQGLLGPRAPYRHETSPSMVFGAPEAVSPRRILRPAAT